MRGSSIPLTANSLPASWQPLPTQTAPPWALMPFLLCPSAVSAYGLKLSLLHPEATEFFLCVSRPPPSSPLSCPSSCCSLSLACAHSVVSDSLQPHGPYPTRLLCPWNFPGKNIGVGCHFLLQKVFPTQGKNPRLLQRHHWQVDSLPLYHQGSPGR